MTFHRLWIQSPSCESYTTFDPFLKMISAQTLIFNTSALTFDFGQFELKTYALSFWYPMLLTITKGIHSELVNKNTH